MARTTGSARRAGFAVLVVCLCTALTGLAGLLVGHGLDRAVAAPSDEPEPVATYRPEDPPSPRGPIVERDGEEDDDPGSVPDEREVPPQRDVAPGANDTVNDLELRRDRDLDVDGAIGGTPPDVPVLSRVRDVVVLIGVVTMVGLVALGGWLWRRQR